MNRSHLVYIVCAVLVGVLMACPAYALSDAEYKQLMKEEEFKTSADGLKQALNDAQKRLTPADYAKIQKIQKNWLAERDNDFKELLSDGMDKTEAWIVIFDSQAEFIAGRTELYALNRTSNPVEGAYEYDFGKAGSVHSGILAVRLSEEQPAVYEVSLEVLTGAPAAPDICSYLGTGILKNKTLIADTEDHDAQVTVVFDGKKATVTASKAANVLCGNGVSLNGMYTK